MIKKIIVAIGLFLSLLCTLSLAGCGGGDIQETTEVAVVVLPETKPASTELPEASPATRNQLL